MAEAKTDTDQEPSIEEILESIRQIISDDDAEEEAADSAPAEKAAAPAEKDSPPPEPPPAAEEEVIELTEEVKEESEDVSAGDIDAMFDGEAEEETAEEPPPPAEEKPRKTVGAATAPKIEMDEKDPIISEEAASATGDALAKLAKNLAVERADDTRLGPVTLEDIVKEILRPMLRDWMDSNLPALIEKLVQKELEKISKRAMDD